MTAHEVSNNNKAEDIKMAEKYNRKALIIYLQSILNLEATRQLIREKKDSESSGYSSRINAIDNKKETIYSYKPYKYFWILFIAGAICFAGFIIGKNYIKSVNIDTPDTTLTHIKIYIGFAFTALFMLFNKEVRTV